MVIVFHTIIGTDFCIDAIGQTIIVAQVERHTEKVITDTVNQSDIGIERSLGHLVKGWRRRK